MYSIFIQVRGEAEDETHPVLLEFRVYYISQVEVN